MIVIELKVKGKKYLGRTGGNNEGNAVLGVEGEDGEEHMREDYEIRAYLLWHER